MPGQTVRLRGSTLKVWDAAALMAQRPLLVVHDGELPPRFGWACACGVGYPAQPAAAAAASVQLFLYEHIRCAVVLHLASAVLKHMQLEDGLLFLWRIADDATIITVGAMLGLACAAAGGGHGCGGADATSKGPNEESACPSRTHLHTTHPHLPPATPPHRVTERARGQPWQ